MILIFGGTTEGRLAARVCDEAQKPFFYATKGSLQQVTMANGKQIQGAMLVKDILDFCNMHNIKLIVDAAHPFAENLHSNIAKASGLLKIPVIRLEREFQHITNNNIHYVDSYHDAIALLEKQNYNKLLALTGVNTIAKLKPYWEKHYTLFRILDRAESHEKAQVNGFPKDQLLYYQKGTDEKALFQSIAPSAIITKESGESGGFSDKINAACSLSIPTIVVKRPTLSPKFITVTGQHGLRKQIEQLVTNFYDLKTGYTTGTCATAATKAAFEYLLTGRKQEEIRITLPNGESVKIPIQQTQQQNDCVTCTVIKDAGDDPDVIHGKAIQSTVSISFQHQSIAFLQGEGVGVVTLPGLGLEIGQPAINKTPRQMIRREIYKIKRHYPDKLPKEKYGIDVTITVPEGKEIAKLTFNPRLGIKDGISIIGTSGIVKPYSSEAFVASIRKEMQVAKALGSSRIVLNSGAKSEKYVKNIYPDLPPQAFVHFGNFIGSSLETANELGFQSLTIVIMIGKAVKLAEGHMDTHSKKVRMNKNFLRKVAQNSHCTPNEIEKINTLTLARQLWEFITTPSFFQNLADSCVQHCTLLFPNKHLEILLIDNDGQRIFKGTL